MEKKFAKKLQTSGHNLKNLFLLLLLPLLFVSALGSSFGHGVGSETFPPVNLDGKQVTVELSSSTSDPETSYDQQISISMIDFDSKITLRDVTFHIKAEKGSQSLKWKFVDHHLFQDHL